MVFQQSMHRKLSPDWYIVVVIGNDVNKSECVTYGESNSVVSLIAEPYLGDGKMAGLLEKVNS